MCKEETLNTITLSVRSWIGGWIACILFACMTVAFGFTMHRQTQENKSLHQQLNTTTQSLAVANESLNAARRELYLWRSETYSRLLRVKGDSPSFDEIWPSQIRILTNPCLDGHGEPIGMSDCASYETRWDEPFVKITLAKKPASR